MNLRIVSILALLAASLAVVQAGEVTVRPVGPAPEPVLHVVGGEPANLALEITAPKGETAKLRVALFQLATSLAAPLGPPVELGEIAGAGALDVSILMPDVKVPTILEARIEARTEEVFTAAGRFRLVVYPSDAMDRLGRFAKGILEESGLRIGVFGKSDAIRSLLRKRRVDFRDLGARPPDSPADKLFLVGDAATPAEVDSLRRMRARRLLVFSDDPTVAPGVYSHVVPEGAFVKVTLPLLETVATDPQSQHTFLEILESMHSQPTDTQ